MSKFIKKFENFSSELNDKAEKTDHGKDENDETGEEMSVDKFNKSHKPVIAGEWDERDHKGNFKDYKKSIEKDIDPIDKLEYSDSTVLESSDHKPKSGVPYKDHELEDKKVKVIKGHLKGKEGVVVSVYPWNKEDLVQIDTGSMVKTFHTSIEDIEVIK